MVTPSLNLIFYIFSYNELRKIKINFIEKFLLYHTPLKQTEIKGYQIQNKKKIMSTYYKPRVREDHATRTHCLE